VRCWIDTDVGDDPDDAIALLCAAAHPDVEIVGVSTVDGDVEMRAELARALVPGVDVVAGPPPSDALAAADTLLLIGPWTHGAELVTRGQLPRRVGAMGGTIRPVIHHGELRVVEHNVSRNPDAARVLLAQQQPLLITPLDVTATIECTREEERALVRAEPRLELMLAHWRRTRGDVALCLHDPLALLALVGEPGIEIERCALSVGRNGVMRSHGALHDIVVAADRQAIVARVLTLLG
jgi:inosine-uridine nucleoside N-ribohydrolase